MWLKKKRGLKLEGLDDNTPLLPCSYEVGPNGVLFYKADIKFDQNGKISKISTGDTMTMQMENITMDQIREGAFIGKGTAGSVTQGLFIPYTYPVAIKTVNIYDKDKRGQLLNDLQLFMFDQKNPSNFCENLVQLYGAFFKDGAIKLV